MMVILLTVLFSLLSAIVALLTWGCKNRRKKAEIARKIQWEDFLRKASSASNMASYPEVAATCAEAGLRAFDALSTDPLLKDPVATLLCGKYGMEYGRLFNKMMQDEEGWGKKPQEVVMARILDDDAAYALAALVKEDQDGAMVQVVCLGCGFDTRPWRLRRGGSGRGSSSHRLVWYEVDRPHTLELKRKMLKDGGIDLDSSDCDLTGAVSHRSKPSHGPSSSVKGKGRAGQPNATYPSLSVDELKCVAVDPSGPSGEVREALQAAGFSPSFPTLWIFEGGILFNMDLARAKALLRECGRASPPRSRLLATVASSTCLKVHPLFCRHSFEDLVGPHGVLEGLGWDKVAAPQSELAEVARSRYRVECFPRFGRFSSVPEAAAGITDVEHVLAATRI